MAEDVESPVPSSIPAASTTQARTTNTRKKKVAAKMGTPKKRYRRTKAQKALDDAEAEKNSTSAKKAKVTKASQSSPKKKNQGTQNDEKFSDLYGEKKTDVGPKVLTKKAAFEIFAIYVNTHSNKRLSLNGILDDNPHATIDELLELKCPCYARFDTIFGTRANVAPLSQFDSLRPTPLNRPVNKDDDLLENDWVDSQSQQPENGDIGDISNLMSIDELVPPLSDKDPDESTPAFVTCTTLVCCDPNQASASAQETTSSSVPINPPPGTVPITPTPSAPRHSFANQNNASEVAPPKERPDKAKSSLVTAYQSVSEKKYEMLKTNLVWQKDQFQQETQMRQESEN
ncbi:hypothetical protein MJO28_005995 [Puccinia striiformis f. sp. tritici]|uniref:Uncharacterized protein n=2 Tax=Puccinia striiformis TaxID=27350 RepID=A0A2S4VPK7_9BASI|nr:hypothetical protein MJO28_005995 [Puccinia striiformis f. sp. tritici]POW11368.1 hypothetical protein PSTT_05380 [Puccinia striiformis]